MSMMDEISAKRDEIALFARRHKAEKLWVFGSCACGEERADLESYKTGKRTELD